MRANLVDGDCYIFACVFNLPVGAGDTLEQDMLDEVEFTTLFDRLGTTEQGRRLIRSARRKAPVRQVRSRGGNVLVLFNSRKMGRVLECESHRVEFPFAFLLEQDAGVIEYYLQPCALDIEVRDEAGKVVTRFQHFPDVLFVRDDGIFIEEWKDPNVIALLAARQPHRYQRHDDGGWRNPHVERLLADYGISYRIRTSDEIPQRYLENLLFLRSYTEPGLAPLSEGKLSLIRRQFTDSACLFLAELIEETTDVTSDDIFQAIVEGFVVADLYKESLADARRVRIYRDKETLEFLSQAEALVDDGALERLDGVIEPGATLVFDGVEHQVSLCGEDSLVLTKDGYSTNMVQLDTIENLLRQGRIQIHSSHETTQLQLETSIDQFGSNQLEQAILRREILEGKATGEVSERTKREWRRRRREAPEGALSPLAALVPRTHERGNRNRKVPPEVVTVMQDVAVRDYFSPENKQLTHCYKLVVAACHERGLNPPSYVTFWNEVKRLKSTSATRNRSGKRVAYNESPHYIHLEYRVPVHGVRPWEVVHIDHTELDIELTCKKTGKVLGRPWLSLAMDACTRRDMGFSLSFEPPSYRSCMMVIRDIVRRHGRLPDTLVVDNGKEFKSRDFQLLTQACGCDIRYRPAARARFGSVLERMFGVVNKGFIHNLAGNTQVMTRV